MNVPRGKKRQPRREHELFRAMHDHPGTSVLVTPPNALCRRCKSHFNVLRLRPFAVAGLTDRYYQIRLLANIAGSLCAKLDVGRPCDYLDPIHNRPHGPLRCEVPFSRFFELTLIDGRRAALTSISNMSASGRYLLRTDRHPVNVTAVYERAASLLKRGVRFIWSWELGDNELISALRRAFGSPWSLPRHSREDAGQHLWLAGGPLAPNVWGYPWHVPGAQQRLELRSKESSSQHACSYVSSRPSQIVLAIKNRTLARLDLQAGRFWAIHLRRGDATSACDTRASTILNWLNCSSTLAGAFAIFPELLPAILFTDESQPTYARTLTHEMMTSTAQLMAAPVQAEPGPTSGTARFSAALHADPYIRACVAEVNSDAQQDNFLIFAVGLAVQSEAYAKFERRRQFECTPCARPLWTRRSTNDSRWTWFNEVVLHDNHMSLSSDVW